MRRSHAASVHRQAAQIEFLHAAKRADALIGHGVRENDVAPLRNGAQNAGEPVLRAIREYDPACVALAGDIGQPTGDCGGMPSAESCSTHLREPAKYQTGSNNASERPVRFERCETA
jgi:hypothetical protein